MTDWVNLRQGEDMLFAGDGRIFRLRQWHSHAQGAYLSAADELADFRGLSFQLLEAPSWAMHW